MASIEPMLQISRVSKRFELAGDTIEALSPIELAIARGEFVCLIGASGCGKSTLLRIIAGFETASAGEVLVAGKPVAGPGPDRGMVFQDYGLFPWMTVRQNIGFGPTQRGLPRPEVRDIAHVLRERHVLRSDALRIKLEPYRDADRSLLAVRMQVEVQMDLRARLDQPP